MKACAKNAFFPPLCMRNILLSFIFIERVQTIEASHKKVLLSASLLAISILMCQNKQRFSPFLTLASHSKWGLRKEETSVT